MSLASIAKDLEHVAKKARMTQKARCKRIDDVICELEKARTALESLDSGGEEGFGGGCSNGRASGVTRGPSVEAMDIDGECSDFSHASEDAGGAAERGGAMAGGVSDILVEDILERLECDVMCATATQSLAAVDKEFAGLLTKLGKAVDKVMPHDISKAVPPAEFPPAILNQVILEHFIRCGRVDLAREFAREAELPLDEAQVAPYLRILKVIEEIKVKKLDLAIAFVENNQERLTQMNSSLAFHVAKMRYLQLLELGLVLEAILFAKKSLTGFYDKHASEVRQLMGCVAFLKKGLENSPYKHLVASDTWPQLCDLFWCDACEALDIQHHKPLSICVNAGIAAMPTLLKFAAVMQGRVGDSSSKKSALPVEVDLGHEFHFHSVFICPVSREQASRDNPPMMMQCGHVLCEQALRKLSRTGGRFKCPYCPLEVSLAASLRLTF